MHESSTSPTGSLHVSDLARRTDVTPATVRYYARTGLIESRRDPKNGYRCFSGADIHRIAFIRQAQGLGLTIAEIKRILDAVARSESPCDLVKSLVEQRLELVRKQVAELRATETRIRQAIAIWEAIDDPIPDDGELCPLIERLDIQDTGSSVHARHGTPASNSGYGCTRENVNAMRGTG